MWLVTKGMPGRPCAGRGLIGARLTSSDRPARYAEALVVGVDFGTLSGRAVVVRVADGAELGSAVMDYRHGGGRPAPDARCPLEWALQVPADYLDVLRTAVPAALRARAPIPPR